MGYLARDGVKVMGAAETQVAPGKGNFWSRNARKNSETEIGNLN